MAAKKKPKTAAGKRTRTPRLVEDTPTRDHRAIDAREQLNKRKQVNGAA